MKSPKVLLIFVLLLVAGLVNSLQPSIAQAQSNVDAEIAARVSTFKDFVQISDGRKIYVEAEIIDPSRPTKMIFNGLTNSAGGSFRLMSDAFLKQGYNVIRFDFPGQAKTLLANLPLQGDFSVPAQVAVVKDLMPKLERQFRLKGGFDVLGQSYGGGIILGVATLEPEFALRYFRTTTVYAPFTEALRDQDEQIRREIKAWRTLYPNLRYTDTELYDMIFYRKVMSSYWMFEPEILGTTTAETTLFLKGVFELGRGIRPFTAADYVGSLPPELKINVVIAASDQYIPGDVIPKFWDALPERNRGYFIEIYGSEHKLFQAVPYFSADVAELTTHPVSQIPLGSKFEAYQITGRIHVGRARYNLKDLIRTPGNGSQGAFFSAKTGFKLAGATCEGVFAP